MLYLGQDLKVNSSKRVTTYPTAIVKFCDAVKVYGRGFACTNPRPRRVGASMLPRVYWFSCAAAPAVASSFYFLLHTTSFLCLYLPHPPHLVRLLAPLGISSRLWPCLLFRLTGLLYSTPVTSTSAVIVFCPLVLRPLVSFLLFS